MKTLILIVALLIATVANAQMVSVDWTHTMVLADSVNTNIRFYKDTVRSSNIDIGPASRVWFWFKKSVSSYGSDLASTGDYTKVNLQHSADGLNWTTWTLADSVPVFAADSVFQVTTANAKAVRRDSIAFGNLLRLQVIVTDTGVTWNRALLGNTYARKYTLYTIPVK